MRAATLWILASGCPWVGAGELAERNDRDTDGVTGLFDCDDTNADAGLPPLWYPDADGDGQGAGEPAAACTRPDRYVAVAGDCDDDDGDVFVGAIERCNERDDDCDGRSDDDDDAVAGTRVFYADGDDDGWPAAGAAVTACQPPARHVEAREAWDCDDTDADANPDRDEVCADDLDNDCDGAVDEEGDAFRVRSDVDVDGFSPSLEVLEVCALPAGFVREGDVHPSELDCDDVSAAVYPGAFDAWYDAIDSDCDGADDFDQDGDGVRSDGIAAPTLGEDCNDLDPGNAVARQFEVPYDGIDQDCDGADLVDVDQDGFVGGPGGTDCNDFDDDIHPGAAEVCGLPADEDCDGDTTTSAAEPEHHLDADGDGWFDDAAPVRWCDPPDGWTTEPGEAGVDCNDANPLVNPGVADTPYDTVDNDCDGADLVDVDGDTFAGGPGGDDCDDDLATVHPGSVEACNAIDDDCDGATDEQGAAGAVSQYVDADGDGVGGDHDDALICPGTLGYTLVANGGDDCDDGDPDVFPGAQEQWYDGRDQDCDGADDYDQDADGFNVDEDCDDADPDVFPTDQGEVCGDGIDGDCDGVTDFRATAGQGIPSWVDTDRDGYPGSLTAVDLCGPFDGWVEVDANLDVDCHDGDAKIHPGHDEDQDGVDSDCDGLDADLDQDGFDDAGDDCDPGDPAVHPGADEWCDDVDQDCDNDLEAATFRVTAWAGGVPTDVTGTLVGLDLTPYDEVTLCGSGALQIGFVAGPGAVSIRTLSASVEIGGDPAVHVQDPDAVVDVAKAIVVSGQDHPVFVVSAGALHLSEVSFKDLRAPLVVASGDAAVTIEGGEWTGGSTSAIDVTGGTPSIDARGTVVDQHAEPMVRSSDLADPVVNLTEVTAVGAGGLVDAGPGFFDLLGCTVEGATDTAVSVSSATLTVSRSTFTGNQGASGGSVAAWDSTVTFDSDHFELGRADQGGAVWLAGGSTLVESRTEYVDCQAEEGGALWLDDASVTSTRAIVSGNSASDGGGGAFLQSASIGNWSSSLFDGNAAARGGGLLLDSSIAVVVGGEFVGQTGSGVELTASNTSALLGVHVRFDHNSPGDIGDQSYTDITGTGLFVCVGDQAPPCTF